jgi:BirA family biotin operon repressor/biotin-[acetyl-CoA-carboxylase] ligase
MLDDISPEIIKQGLSTSFIGQNILYHTRLASTMDTARQAALASAPEGTVVLAEEQKAGRGRLKRAWLSPAGCLTLSVVLYPEMRFLPFLVMVAALAVADTVEETGLKAEIKWPNDILINGKKVSGILIETGIREGEPNYVVIGIGLNVNLNPVDCPEIRESATSLMAESGEKVARIPTLQTLLVRLEYWYQALLKSEPVFASWRRRLTTLGKTVQVLAGSVRYQGVAEGVAPDGALLLRLESGQLIKLPAGDVTLKPYQES